MTTLLKKQVPPLYFWTTLQYEQMTISGVLKPEDRIELIGGIIYEKMPQNSPHSTWISEVEALLVTIMPHGVYRRTQMPLWLGDDSMPEPDIAIVEGSFRDFEKNHPTTATLVVEVSDTTLHFDRSEKLSLYASANVTKYWILDLNSRKLEVYRIPDRSVGRYLQKRILSENDFVSPAFAPGCEISIEDLLPVASSD